LEAGGVKKIDCETSVDSGHEVNFRYVVRIAHTWLATGTLRYERMDSLKPSANKWKKNKHERNALVIVLSTVIAIAFAMSISLFYLNIFVWKRRASGQLRGLVYTLVAFICFLILYADRLPLVPLSVRDILELLPGIDHADVLFGSPSVALWALLFIFILRAAIFIRLFVVPAIALSDEEYGAPDQVESRTNDETAPVLACAALICVGTALLGSLYALTAIETSLIALGFVGLYVAKPFIQKLNRIVATVIGSIRIGLSYVGMALSTMLIATIVPIARLERWRRGLSEDDEGFYRAIAVRIKDGQDRARLRIANERKKLRDSNSEESKREVRAA
jgi:hypothetical protein